MFNKKGDVKDEYPDSAPGSNDSVSTNLTLHLVLVALFICESWHKIKDSILRK